MLLFFIFIYPQHCVTKIVFFLYFYLELYQVSQ